MDPRKEINNQNFNALHDPFLVNRIRFIDNTIKKIQIANFKPRKTKKPQFHNKIEAFLYFSNNLN
jgi:hypothetical protein